MHVGLQSSTGFSSAKVPIPTCKLYVWAQGLTLTYLNEKNVQSAFRQVLSKSMFNCLSRNMNIYSCTTYKRNDIIVENIASFPENEVNLTC